MIHAVIPKPKALRLPDPRPLEKEIERKVCEYAKAKGFYVRKFVSPAHRSVPDRYFIAPGSPGSTPDELTTTLYMRLFKVEFKRQGEEPTDAQKREHRELRSYGVRVFVIDNANDGKALIDRILREYVKDDKM